MIVFNKTWNNDVLSKALLDIIQPSFSTGYCGECDDFGAQGALVGGICTQSKQSVNSNNIGVASPAEGDAAAKVAAAAVADTRLRLQNFSIVTEKFLKVLDKFYTKLWSEDFTNSVFYGQHIISIFQGIANPAKYIYFGKVGKYYNRNHGSPQIIKTKPLSGTANEHESAGINPNDFKIIIDRMISLGLMSEEDRLDLKDQSFLTGLLRSDFQIINNTSEKTIDIICNKISDIVPDIKTENLSYKEGVDQTGVGMSVEHSFHKDKRLFLMYTPYLKNETTVKYSVLTDFTPEEPTTMQILKNFLYSHNMIYGTAFSGVSHEPVSYFKPKTYQTKFNKGSMPMATHLIWRIGTQETRETAITENSPFVPEVIFDHVDRISHIDNFKLRIKYNVVRF